MTMIISGQDMEIGDALRTKTEEKVHVLCSKYDLDPLDVRIVYSHEGSPHHPLTRCDIEMHIKHDFYLRCHKETDDPHVSLDEALKTFESRLQRHKEKVIDHIRHRD